ncbi:hypothetical protein NQ176_g7868 [Zarea fungicola]|uniref:Uncharacterized protein n=1 Tax=Zarea fungicola TaxID=93591 RepID=A0ACC1MXX7_9HYPO|nr:hypothetical protein NQ176_g7868 [Lecanicillium fungicola]
MQSFVSLFSTVLLLTNGLQVLANGAVSDCTSVSTHILPTVTNTIDLPTSTLQLRDDNPATTSSSVTTAAGTTLTSVTQSTNAETSKPVSSSTKTVPSQQPTGTGSPVVAAGASGLQRLSVLQLSALIAVIGGVMIV